MLVDDCLKRERKEVSDALQIQTLNLMINYNINYELYISTYINFDIFGKGIRRIRCKFD
jgi:hypothetical protein